MRLMLALALLAIPLAAAQDVPTQDVAEGVVVRASGPAALRWTEPAGAWSYVAAVEAPGARLVEPLGAQPADGSPSTGTHSSLWTARGDPLVVRIEEGNASFVLARRDLLHGEGNGTVARLRAAADVPPGECRAWHVTSTVFGSLGDGSVTHGDVEFVMAGANLTLRHHDAGLRVQREARDALVHAGDPDAEAAPFLLQACNEGEASSAVVVVATRRAEPLEAGRATPGLGPGALLALCALVAAGARRARRR